MVFIWSVWTQLGFQEPRCELKILNRFQTNHSIPSFLDVCSHAATVGITIEFTTIWEWFIPTFNYLWWFGGWFLIVISTYIHIIRVSWSHHTLHGPRSHRCSGAKEAKGERKQGQGTQGLAAEGEQSQQIGQIDHIIYIYIYILYIWNDWAYNDKLYINMYDCIYIYIEYRWYILPKWERPGHKPRGRRRTRWKSRPNMAVPKLKRMHGK